MLGNNVFNEATERLSPQLYLCGHVHVPSQILKLNNTTLLNLESSTRHQEYVIAEYERRRIYDIRIISPGSGNSGT
jgi:Icc-related predicted phosphoesterase